MSEKNIWICPSLSAEEHVKKINSIDILVSDIDNTITNHQAKSVVVNKILREPKYLFNPNLWKSIGSYLFKKDGEVEAWRNLIEHFIDDKDKDKISKEYTTEYVESKMFDGFFGFISVFPQDLVKIYLTRNLIEIGNAYKQATGFDDVFAEHYDKKAGIQKIVDKYPDRKRIGIIGDSVGDEVAYEYLSWLENKGKIDYYYSIHVGSINKGCHLNLKKRDFRPLVKFLDNYKD